MSDILSQAEIDELLNALTTGSDTEPVETQAAFLDVKAHDFRKANRFQKEQIRTLNVVFQSYAQLLANKLGAILRTTCDCEVLSVEEQIFNEFNNSLPMPVMLCIIRMAPMRGTMVMELSPEISYTIINRLLGGSKNAESNKQFSEIELALIQHVMRQTIGIFEKAWEKVIRVSAQLERIETSPQFAQIVSLNDTVVIITLNITIGDDSGLISICIPYTSIEPIASQLNTLLWFSSQDSSEIIKNPEQLTEMLVHSPVSLTAYFEDTPATVGDIMNLQVGDVIRLNQRIQQPVMVKIEHIPKFYAQIGTSGSKYAVKVVDIIKGENPDAQYDAR